MKRCDEFKMNYWNANTQTQYAFQETYSSDYWDAYEAEILKLQLELNTGTYLPSLPAAPPDTSDNRSNQQINDLYFEGGYVEDAPTSTGFQSSPSNEADHTLLYQTEGQHTSSTTPPDRNPNRYYCTYQGCTREYGSNDALRAHKLKHHNMKRTERPIFCKYEGCNQSFFYHDSYTHHLRTHCKYEGCHQYFSNEGLLAKHVKTHGAPVDHYRNVLCSYCGKEVYRWSLTYHITRVHK